MDSKNGEEEFRLSRKRFVGFRRVLGGARDKRHGLVGLDVVTAVDRWMRDNPDKREPSGCVGRV